MAPESLALLRRYSPAFSAYEELKSIPAHVPHLTTNANGFAVDHQGEVLCRMAGSGSRTHCGARYTRNYDLRRHLQKDHKVPVELRGKKARTLSWPALKFYIDVMKHQEYAGKGGPLEMDVDNMPLKYGKRTYQANPSRSDDEEPTQVSRRRPQRRKARSLSIESDGQSGFVLGDGEVLDGNGETEGQQPQRGSASEVFVASVDSPPVERVAATGNTKTEVKEEETLEPARGLQSSLGDRHRSQVQKKPVSRRQIPIDLTGDNSDASMESDSDDEARSQLETLRVQREMKQIELQEKRIALQEKQMELQEMQLKQQLAARKRRRIA